MRRLYERGASRRWSGASKALLKSAIISCIRTASGTARRFDGTVSIRFPWRARREKRSGEVPPESAKANSPRVRCRGGQRQAQPDTLALDRATEVFISTAVIRPVRSLHTAVRAYAVALYSRANMSGYRIKRHAGFLCVGAQGPVRPPAGSVEAWCRPTAICSRPWTARWPKKKSA